MIGLTEGEWLIARVRDGELEVFRGAPGQDVGIVYRDRDGEMDFNTIALRGTELVATQYPHKDGGLDYLPTVEDLDPLTLARAWDEDTQRVTIEVSNGAE